MKDPTRNIKIARKVLFRIAKKSFASNRTASVVEAEEIFIHRYDDIVSAVISNGDIISSLIEDLVNSGRLQIKMGSILLDGQKLV